MTFLKQLALVLSGFVLIGALPGFLYGLATGETSDRLTSFSFVLAILWLLGGVIYLAVAAALRSRN